MARTALKHQECANADICWERLTKMRDANKYRPRVAASDRTTFRKIELLKMESAVRGPVVSSTFSTALKARKNAANYEMMSGYQRSETRRKSNRHVDRDDGESKDGSSIAPLASLRSITQTQEEAHDEKTEVEVLKNVVHVFDVLYLEGWILHCIGENDEGNVVVAEREPGEDQIEHLVDEFDVDPGLADERV
jgi:hypothetical protein